MFGGDSRSDSRSSTTTETQNLNLQDIEGLAIAGVDGPVSLTFSDQGAIEGAVQIAEAGIGAFSENVDLTRDIINASASQSESLAGLTSAVLARESDNTDPRIQTIAITALIAVSTIVAIIIFKG